MDTAKSLEDANKSKLLSFKFAFEDATITELKAKDIKDAVVLAVSNRIRGNKSARTVAAWSKGVGEKTWGKVNQQSVTIQLF